MQENQYPYHVIVVNWVVKSKACEVELIVFGSVVQLVERCIHIAKVTGSSPVGSTLCLLIQRALQRGSSRIISCFDTL